MHLAKPLGLLEHRAGQLRDGGKRNPPLEEGLHRHLVGRVKDGASSPAEL